MMKSAEERALGLWDALPSAAKTAVDLNYRTSGGDGMRKWLNDVALSFKEHARDQRECAAREYTRLRGGWKGMEPETVIVNAPEPGKEKEAGR